jgi:hypothetical protein
MKIAETLKFQVIYGIIQLAYLKLYKGDYV